MREKLKERSLTKPLVVGVGLVCLVMVFRMAVFQILFLILIPMMIRLSKDLNKVNLQKEWAAVR